MRSRPWRGNVSHRRHADRNETENEDLGFGSVVAEKVRGRFLNKDGTPNSRKYGLGMQVAQRLQLRGLNASWPVFLIWLVGLTLLANGIFALGYISIVGRHGFTERLRYISIGPKAIGGTEALGLEDPFLRAFAFSVGIFTMVGTGPLHAVGTTANWWWRWSRSRAR